MIAYGKTYTTRNSVKVTKSGLFKSFDHVAYILHLIRTMLSVNEISAYVIGIDTTSVVIL